MGFAKEITFYKTYLNTFSSVGKSTLIVYVLRLDQKQMRLDLKGVRMRMGRIQQRGILNVYGGEFITTNIEMEGMETKTEKR